MEMLRIGHYAYDLGAPGGVTTYAMRVGAAQAAGGHAVVYFTGAAEARGASAPYRFVSDAAALYRDAAALDLDVLHLHKAVPVLPPPSLPVVRTVHGNQGACPSGRRYLGRQEQPCDRTFGVATCLWGHVVDACGSRKPQTIVSNIQRTIRERRLLPQMLAYTVSRYLREQLVRTGYPPDRLHTVPSPAPDILGEPPPIPDEPVPRLLYLGRIVPQKGLGWLLRALARVTAPVHLDVAGDGYELEAMRHLAGSLGLRDRVTFHGWVPGGAVPDLMARARAVVFPSIWHEPAGLVSLEAAAYGRPVIASRVGGIPEYALDAFARLVPPTDEAALAEAITALATDRDLAVRLGHAGRRAVREQFTMDTFLERLFELYRQARAEAVPTALAP